MAEYERAKTGTTQKVDRVALLCDLRQFPRHIRHKSNAFTLIRPGREAIYSDCRPRLHVVADGWSAFFLLFRSRRALKKAGIFFYLYVRNASCAPILAMKRPFECAASQAVLQTKMEFFLDLVRNDQFVAAADTDRFAIAH